MSHDHEHPQHEPADAGGRALNDALAAAFRVLRGVMLLLVVVYLASGVFVVKQHEKAMVLVLGKISGLGGERVKGPGVHWTWPRPVSEIIVLPAERVQTLNVDSFWYRREADFQDNAAPPSALRPDSEGYLITGDANLLHTRWAVRYTLDQPEAAAFGWASLESALRQELERAVSRAASRTPIDRALRTDVEAFRAAAESEFRSRCEALNLGVRVQGVDLTAATAPPQVAEAFENVTKSEMDRSKQVSEARAYAERTKNEAVGEAEKRIAEGRAYQQKIISETASEADYFEKVLKQYLLNPAVVRGALLRAGVQRALSTVEQKYVTPGRGEEVRVLLSPEKKKIGTP